MCAYDGMRIGPRRRSTSLIAGAMITLMVALMPANYFEFGSYTQSGPKLAYYKHYFNVYLLTINTYFLHICLL